jgi:hypothetical protein
MVAGLALVGVTAQNVAPSAGLIDPTRPFSYRPPLAVSILQIISLPAIPLGMLVGLIGVLLFVGTSPVARWGVALAAVATLLLIVEPFVTYVFWFGSNGASPGYGTITAMFFLTRAVSVLSSLVLAAGIVLLVVADRRDQKLGARRTLLLAIAIATVLSGATPFALGSVGLAGGATLGTVSELAVGLLWMALGMALWRYVPENWNVGTTPLTP